MITEFGDFKEVGIWVIIKDYLGENKIGKVIEVKRRKSYDSLAEEDVEIDPLFLVKVYSDGNKIESLWKHKIDIIRHATKEEIEQFKIKIETDKFNL